MLTRILALDFDAAIPGNGPVLTKADVQAFKTKFDTVIDRATALVRSGVPKDQLLMQLKTDDIGWAPRVPNIDAFYNELSGITAGKAYKFEKVADGVFYATATGSMVTGSNNVAIVGDRDVLVVDTGTSPAAARAFVDDLKLVTSKPVRYVVNTHFHYDHTDGNQVYAGKADIIAHDYVKYAIEKLDVLHREPYQTSQLTNVPARIETLKKRIADETNAQQKTALERQLAVAQQGLGRAEGDQADAAERDLLEEEGRQPRRPRSADALSRTRPHERRHRGVPAEGKDRLHGRSDGIADWRTWATRSSTSGWRRSRRSRRWTGRSTFPVTARHSRTRDSSRRSRATWRIS